MNRRKSWALVAAASLAGVLLTAGPASATTEQALIMSPVDGKVTSAPPHKGFEGDWAMDIGAGAGSAVHVRFAKPTGNLALNITRIGESCSSGRRGGQMVTVEAHVDGVLLGRTNYLHLANARGVGPLNNGDQIGVVAGNLPYNELCWTGPHVHLEPRNASKYSCHAGVGVGAVVNGGTVLGVFGGEWATGVNSRCPDEAWKDPPDENPTAQTGADGANLRTDTNTSAQILTTIPGRTTIRLECWRRGQPVTAQTGTYSLWHRTSYGGHQGFVADATLNTPAFPNAGADQPAPNEPPCPSPPPVNPSVGVSPTSGDSSTRFTGTATGFTPNGTVSLTVYNPDGSEHAGSYNRTKTTDGAGAFSWSWIWASGDPFGTYRFVAKDPTGPTAETTFTITKPEEEPPPPDLVLGFDKASAPSLAEIQAWQASPYRAVGVYLPVAPGTDNRYDKQQTNLTPEWVRSVRDLGWTVLPIYIGMQAPSACFPQDYWTMSSDPATARQQGREAATYAVEQAFSLRLPSTTPIFYDMEAYNAGCSAAVLAFFEGWSAGIESSGYRSGVYGSQASAMRDLSTKAGDTTYDSPDSVWVATDNGAPRTTGLGTPPDGTWTGARINQYHLNVSRTYGGVTLNIDENAVDKGLLSSSSAGPPWRPTQSPSPSVSPTQPPGPGSCATTLISLASATINATGQALVRVQGSAGGTVDLFAYTRPSTTFRLVRTAVTAADGTATFTIRPPANTRLYAQARGCPPSEQVVQNVRTTLSFAVTRNGTRSYTFTGDSLPARSGGLIVSLYRRGSDGREVLTAQTRANAFNGEWSFVRRFTGGGRFEFLVRTGQDLQNAPGVSNVRSLLVY
jgi:hypothetical protein